LDSEKFVILSSKVIKSHSNNFEKYFFIELKILFKCHLKVFDLLSSHLNLKFNILFALLSSNLLDKYS
jgi:hypothetical protein